MADCLRPVTGLVDEIDESQMVGKIDYQWSGPEASPEAIAAD